MDRGELPWHAASPWSPVILRGAAALAMGTLAWGRLHGWGAVVERLPVAPLLAGSLAGALVLLDGALPGRRELAPRWWHGALLGLSCGVLRVGTCLLGQIEILVLGPLWLVFDVLFGAFCAWLLQRERAIRASTGLDRLPRALVASGVWLALSVVWLLPVGHCFLAPWLRFVALLGLALSGGGVAIAWRRGRWLRRVAGGRNEGWELAKMEAPAGLPELPGPDALENEVLVRRESPGAVYREATARPVARLVPARWLGAAFAPVLAAAALGAALRIDADAQPAIAARCELYNEARDDGRWDDAYAVMAPSYRAIHTVEDFRSGSEPVGCPADEHRVKVFLDWSSWGGYPQWIRIGGQWFLTYDDREMWVSPF